MALIGNGAQSEFRPSHSIACSASGNCGCSTRIEGDAKLEHNLRSMPELGDLRLCAPRRARTPARSGYRHDRHRDKRNAVILTPP